MKTLRFEVLSQDEIERIHHASMEVFAILFAWRYPISRERHRAACQALAGE